MKSSPSTGGWDSIWQGVRWSGQLAAFGSVRAQFNWQSTWRESHGGGRN
jgi:hypothetical protein